MDMDVQFQDGFLRAWSIIIPFSRHSVLQKALSPLQHQQKEGRKICKASIHGAIAIPYEEWYKNSSICKRRTNRTLSYYIRTQVFDEINSIRPPYDLT
jgi:hypothetical protein